MVIEGVGRVLGLVERVGAGHYAVVVAQVVLGSPPGTQAAQSLATVSYCTQHLFVALAVHASLLTREMNIKHVGLVWQEYEQVC